MTFKKSIFSQITALTIFSLSSFAQSSFDYSVNDGHLKLGRVNVYTPALRQMVLDSKSGGVRDCISVLQNDGSVEDYQGVSSEKSLECTMVRGADGEVHIELKGYVQVSISNYQGISGDVRVYYNEADSSGIPISGDHTFSMSTANPTQAHWFAFKYIRSWSQIVEGSTDNVSVLTRAINFKLDFVATETP